MLTFNIRKTAVMAATVGRPAMLAVHQRKTRNSPAIRVLGAIALISCFLGFSDPAWAFTMGLLPPNPLCAGSAVQINGFGPFPAGTVGSFGQTVCATPPDFANSLFQKSISGGATIETGEANMSMGTGSFTTLVTAAATAITNGLGPSASTTGSFEDQLMIGGGTGSGTMLLPLHITGSVGMVFNTPVGQPPFRFMEAGFSFSCQTIPITVSGQGGSCGGSSNFGLNQGHAQFVFDHPQSVDMTFLMTIPFTFNEEFILDRAVFFSAGLIPPVTTHTAGYYM